MIACAAPPFAADRALVDDTSWRAHDLLRLRRLPSFDGEPDWVRDAFARAPFAVVRRAPVADGFVAIGLRGTGRAQRYGTWVNAEDIEAILTPEALAQRMPVAERRPLPAFAAWMALTTLSDAAPGALSLSRFNWGPTGSVGFELATQVATVTESSDLDVLIRTPHRLSQHTATLLLDELQVHAQRAGIRIDAQLDTPAGGVALIEWAAGKSRVMARHAQGPRLIADPWAAAATGDA